MNKRIILIVGVLMSALVVAYYFYKRRKRPFEDYGRADWGGDTDRKTLSYRVEHKPIVKKGDIVDIVYDNDNIKSGMGGKAEVVEILTPSQSWNKTSYWIVTDKKHQATGTQEPGTYRKA